MLDIKAALNGTLRRMHNVQRYSSIPFVRSENVAEHSWQVAMLCYLIGNDLRESGHTVKMGDLLEKAVVHDVSETLSGDIIRSYKHGHPFMRRACAEADHMNMDKLAEQLGDNDIYTCWVNAKDKTLEGSIVGLSDMLCVVSYCVAEHKLGNSEIDGVLSDLYDTVLVTYHHHNPLKAYVDPIFPNQKWDDAYNMEGTRWT